MAITVELRLSADERKLAGILSCKVADLEETLTHHCKAALEEYVRMFLGQKVFTRGSDIREYRLFLLDRDIVELKRLSFSSSSGRDGGHVGPRRERRPPPPAIS